MNHKFIPTLTFILLVSYTVILCMGNGYTCDESNILSIIDRQLFGEAHLYQKSPIDPEGFVSTLSAIAHTCIGFSCGKWIIQSHQTENKVLRLFLTGFILMSIGYLLADALPLNKRIWSPTFVLVTCGAASMSLATLMYYIDIRNKQKWCRFFIIFGVNPLFLYVLSEVLAIMMGSTGWKAAAYAAIHSGITDATLPQPSTPSFSLCFWGVSVIRYILRKYTSNCNNRFTIYRELYSIKQEHINQNQN